MLRRWFHATALGWRQLVKEKNRFAVAILGIAFADILIYAQMGFEASLFESSTAPQKSFNADLVLVNSQFRTVYSAKNIPRERLQQVLGFNGVDSVSPLYIAVGKWKNPENHQKQSILVFGIDPRTQAFKLPEVNQNLQQLQKLNTVLFDRASFPDYGAIASLYAQKSLVEAELNGMNVRVAGLFSLGASFAAYGNVIISDSTFMLLFSDRHPNQVQLGLIKLKPGANRQEVVDNLRNNLPNDVQVLTPEELNRSEKSYWAKKTPFGFIFGLGVVVSFVIGVVIVYQIIYVDLNDHLPEYAMLKAIGYSDRYLILVLVQQSLFLALLGYLPAFLISLGIYQTVATTTMLPIFMTMERGVHVLILTVSMCLIATASAVHKLQSADPGDIF
ncbi:ABC transporter permease DevC [Calothrix sp. 336/3]|uniref:ABC transporter permease DevC n=1 Tax=Calothrix sp. 336/3 TaxID=1337936 RepID=UPI0004E42A87|nr:ABC transporter permease DevC [Calothrix sp. 336/3]AKG23077.1 ABC transporter [Calothrix sp. 336/3]